MVAPLRVGDALTAVSFRVYPSTPFLEVLDLMARRHLHAVPVVGENYQVLGIITTGDALKAVLRAGGSRAGGVDSGVVGAMAARDVMTRAVLCVSEDQLLAEAAQIMANRDVEQLPVVRDGALVGFLSRDSLLKALRSTLPTIHSDISIEEEPG